MKSRLLIIILALTGAVAWNCTKAAEPYTDASEGRSIEWGPRGNFDVAIPGGSHGLYGTGAGVDLGLGMRVPLGKSFFVEPELLAFYNTLSTDHIAEQGSVYSGQVRNVGIRVPLMAGYTFGVSDNVSMAVSTGPWLNVNLMAREYATPNFATPLVDPSGSINLFPKGFKRVEALWGIKLSATFAGCYTVAVTTGVGFTPLAVYGNRDNKLKIRRNTLAISLGYNF